MVSRHIALITTTVFLLLAACTPGPGQPEPTASTPLIGNIIPYGEPIPRTTGTTYETVPNCLGNDPSRLPSRQNTTAYSVEWRSGSEAGIGFTLGEGVIPGGVNLETAFSETFGQQFIEELTYVDAWELHANEGMVNTVTLLWHEDWQPAYVDVTLPFGGTKRVELSFRTRIYSTLVSEDEEPCDGAEPPQEAIPDDSPVAETATPDSDPAPSDPVPFSPGSEITADILDRLFGSDNWRCTDGFPNGVVLNNVPAGLTVEAPIIRVDKLGEYYNRGSAVPEGGPATVWFQADITGSDCIAAVVQVTRADIDALVGQGNWYCLPDYPTGVKIINVPNGFIVRSPMTLLDKQETRYHKGQMVPEGGEATGWFSSSVYPNNCP